MGKSKSSGSSDKAAKQSSGKRQSCIAKRALMRIKMKIARWERYKAEDKKPAKGSKRTGWDTSGLKKHAALLTQMI